MTDLINRAKADCEWGDETDGILDEVVQAFAHRLKVKTVKGFKDLVRKSGFEPVWTEAVRETGWNTLPGCGLFKLWIIEEIQVRDGTSSVVMLPNFYRVFTSDKSLTHFDGSHHIF